MSYRKEKDLQVDLISRDLGVATSELSYVRTEVSVGECIPDIVYVNFLSKIPNVQFGRNISTHHIFVLWLIKENNKISPEYLAEKSFFRKAKLDQIIKDLLNSNLIIRHDDGYFEADVKIATTQTEVVAIEAKLSNWNQAIGQAKRYQQFANKVIVAMDGERVPRGKEVLEIFIENNIGLCGITPTTLEWLVTPVFTDVDSFEKECLVSSTLSRSAQILWVRRKFKNAVFQAGT